MLRHIRRFFFCGYLRILENVEAFRTPRSDAPATRYATLRFSKDRHLLEILQRVLWHFNTPFTFLDVGAEIGYFSLAASKWARTRATIYSFETNPSLYEILEFNAKRHPGIRPKAIALYNSSEFQNDVPVCSGDTFILDEKLQYVDLLKINAAAASFETLQGFGHTLNNSSKIIVIIDLSSQNLSIAGHTVRDLYEALIGVGLEVHSLNSTQKETSVALLRDIEDLAQQSPLHLIGFKGYKKDEIYTILGCPELVSATA
jgi:hypothetical protein